MCIRDSSWYDHIPLPIRRAIGAVAEQLPPVHGVNFLVRRSRPLEERDVYKRQHLTQGPAGQVGVAQNTGGFKAALLDGPGGKHPFQNGGAALAWLLGAQLIVGHGAYVHMQINPVQQRAGNPLAVPLHCTCLLYTSRCV